MNRRIERDFVHERSLGYQGRDPLNRIENPTTRNQGLKTLNELKAECEAAGIRVTVPGRASKEPYLTALQKYHWERECPGQPLPRQVLPMLLEDWSDLDERSAKDLENDHHSWIVQQKHDGVRVLLHITQDGIRITGRNLSEVTYRLTEFQDNLLHLHSGLERLTDTILDGELVCPRDNVDTGTTLTSSALQAAVAVLAASPDKAATIQRGNDAYLRLHLFDVPEFRGEDTTTLPLTERLRILEEVVGTAENAFVESVSSYSVNKKAIHDSILEAGGEGTVWKKANAPYEPGKRVSHWLKRKRGLEVAAFVTGFKLGSPERGHSHLVGAIEFSVQERGNVRPIAWVSGWSDQERSVMTWKEPNGSPTLNPTYFGRSAIVVGQDEAGKSKRIRHARLARWLDRDEIVA